MDVKDEQIPAKVYRLISVLAVVSALGTIGNVLLFYYFYRRKTNYPARLFVLLLSAVDIVTCLLVIPMNIYIELMKFQTDLILCKIDQFLINTSFMCTALVVMSALLDRYFYFRHPRFAAVRLYNAINISIGIIVVATGTGLVSSLNYR